MAYFDTSVIIAYYSPETFSSQVQDLLREQIKPALSLLTEVEFASAVAKKVRSNELSSLDGNRILAKFISHLVTSDKSFFQSARMLDIDALLID